MWAFLLSLSLLPNGHVCPMGQLWEREQITQPLEAPLFHLYDVASNSTCPLRFGCGTGGPMQYLAGVSLPGTE